jgi:hypothetical protein
MLASREGLEKAQGRLAIPRLSAASGNEDLGDRVAAGLRLPLPGWRSPLLGRFRRRAGLVGSRQRFVSCRPDRDVLCDQPRIEAVVLGQHAAGAGELTKLVRVDTSHRQPRREQGTDERPVAGSPSSGSGELRQPEY